MYTVRVLARRLSGEDIPDGEQRRGCTFQTTREKAFELAKNGSVEILEGDDSRPESDRTGKGAASTSSTAGAPLSSSQAENPQGSSTLDPLTPAGPSSRSATDTGSGAASKPSTPRTGAGGTTTKKKSAARTMKPTDGARTAKRAGTLTSDGSNPSEPPALAAGAATSTSGKE